MPFLSKLEQVVWEAKTHSCQSHIASSSQLRLPGQQPSLRKWGMLFRGSLLVLCAHQYLTRGLLCHREKYKVQNPGSVSIDTALAATEKRLRREDGRPGRLVSETGLPKWAVRRVLPGTPEAPLGTSLACPRQWGWRDCWQTDLLSLYLPLCTRGAGCCAGEQRDAGWPLGEID